MDQVETDDAGQIRDGDVDLGGQSGFRISRGGVGRHCWRVICEQQERRRVGFCAE